MRQFLCLIVPVTLFAAASSVAGAEDNTSSSTPPSRAGRISAIEGQMSLQMPNDQTWANAEINFPVTADMEFRTESPGRAELQFGGALVALAEHTDLRVETLDDDTTVLSVYEGSVDIRVNSLPRSEHLAINTPNGSITVEDVGAYRIDAGDQNSPLRVMSFDGQAEVETNNSNQTLKPESACEANADGVIRNIPVTSVALDDWASAREEKIEASASARYVSTDIPGYEDLDHAGTWQVSKDNGPVWVPSGTPAGWAPYQVGRWIWVQPWGWTWVDNQSWGFAPSHFGRWLFAEGHWAWSPGKRLRHPVYAPAVVGFDGIDPSRFASQHQPPRHWVALGSDEIYRAPYTQDVDYLRKVNKGQVPTETLAATTWDTDEWPTFKNLEHIHLERAVMSAKALQDVPSTTPQDVLSSDDGDGEMVLHIPIEQARRLNLIPEDGNPTAERPKKEREAHARVQHDQTPEPSKVEVHDNLTHPELADRSGLVIPELAPPRIEISREQIEAPNKPSTKPLRPLSRPVIQEEAAKAQPKINAKSTVNKAPRSKDEQSD